MRELFIKSLTDLTDDEWDKLKEYYRTPQRFYHTFDHALEVAEWVIRFNAQCAFPLFKEAIYAALFHDVVYIPSNSDNEFRSADLIDEFPSIITSSWSKHLVCLTKDHFNFPKLLDENDARFLDCDIIGFASDWNTFYSSDLAIRLEFLAHVSLATPDLIKAGRLAFLKKVQAQKYIFNSKYARTVFEQTARDNLNKLIGRYELNEID